MRKSLFTLLLLACATASPAQDNGPGNGSTNGDDQQIRCRSVFVVDSRIPQRICRTRAEWERIAREARDATEAARRNHSASGE